MGGRENDRGSASDRARAAGGAAKRARKVGQGGAGSQRSDSRVSVTDVTAPGALGAMDAAAGQAGSLVNKGLDAALGARSLTSIDTRKRAMTITRPVSNLGLAASVVGALTGATGLGAVAGALDTEKGVLGRTDVSLSSSLDPNKQSGAAGMRGQSGNAGERKDPATQGIPIEAAMARETPGTTPPGTTAKSASAERRQQRRNRPPSLFGPANLAAANLFGV